MKNPLLCFWILAAVAELTLAACLHSLGFVAFAAVPLAMIAANRRARVTP